jgi:gamma-glutamylcyclotransferase (GGCT)/AIG2-like uncharacterized protein YtfP
MSALPPPRKLPLFVYGTLLTEEFAGRLLERPVSGEPARLLDFELRRLEQLEYPVVLEVPGEVVDGRLYREISPEEYDRLDAYEGVAEGLYGRIEARVVAGPEGEKGPPEPAFVYVPTDRTLRRYGAS